MGGRRETGGEQLLFLVCLPFVVLVSFVVVCKRSWSWSVSALTSDVTKLVGADHEYIH